MINIAILGASTSWTPGLVTDLMNVFEEKIEFHLIDIPSTFLVQYELLLVLYFMIFGKFVSFISSLEVFCFRNILGCCGNRIRK